MDIVNIFNGIVSGLFNVITVHIPVSAFASPVVIGTVLWIRKRAKFEALLRMKTRDAYVYSDSDDEEVEVTKLIENLPSTSKCAICACHPGKMNVHRLRSVCEELDVIHPDPRRGGDHRIRGPRY